MRYGAVSKSIHIDIANRDVLSTVNLLCKLQKPVIIHNSSFNVQRVQPPPRPQTDSASQSSDPTPE